MEGDRLTGTVKWFKSRFGFITPDDGRDDVFVHRSSVKADLSQSLAEGDKVEFAIAVDEDGRIKAVDVTSPGKDSFEGSNSAGGGGGSRRGGYGGGSRRGGYGGGRNRVRSCFRCGEAGHIAIDCNIGGGRRWPVGGGRGRECFRCGGTGHYARECSSWRN